MKLVIDLEYETFDEIEDHSDEIKELVEYVASMVGEGYWSAYEPSWHIHDEESDPTMKYLQMMRTQMRNGYHLSDSDMQHIVEAVDEIEALRERMIKERKAK